jgi:hypothetical protein
MLSRRCLWNKWNQSFTEASLTGSIYHRAQTLGAFLMARAIEVIEIGLVCSEENCHC